ncbi:unnamed protein product [Peronospora farinosa]|uniref:Uncharacterized protein n=1 Tax=Peronospora farinosa TaxID=134698 RepID=A0AAV0TMT8_9STRA|nr:unnamed protein product [Peronospora farinosa]
MGRSTGDEFASEWSFTETLSLDDVEILQREQLENGGAQTVSYASAIQGRDTSKITYRELRKICSYLGVRYYKNRPKNLMLELIAQKKLNGEVPTRYKSVKISGNKTTKGLSENTDNENHEEHLVSASNPLSNNHKRQRVTTDKPVPAAAVVNSSSPINTFLQPVSPTRSDLRRSPLTNLTSGISTTPIQSEPSAIYVGMSLKDRIDALNLLYHIRQQIQNVEETISTLTDNDSSTKTQRLNEDLQFYLAERRSFIQQLGNSR